MHLFHKKQGLLRPLPAGIPIDGTNYSKIRDGINQMRPLIFKQQVLIVRNSSKFDLLRERQHRILHTFLNTVWTLTTHCEEPWLSEFNDVRVAMELRDVTLRRVKNQAPEQIDEEYERQHWKSYQDNHTHLLYLMNRLAKELADYEHGPWWWITHECPIPEPEFPPDAAKTTAVDPEKNGEEAKKVKHVSFERRVQGWYFNDDDIPAITGRGDDERGRKKAHFANRVVDGKSTAKNMQRRPKINGYVRCTEGFAQPQPRCLPDEYRLTRMGRPWVLD